MGIEIDRKRLVPENYHRFSDRLERVTVEIDCFNLECNLRHTELRRRPFSHLRTELENAASGEGASTKRFALCRRGHSANKSFCSGARWHHPFDEHAKQAGQ